MKQTVTFIFTYAYVEKSRKIYTNVVIVILTVGLLNDIFLSFLYFSPLSNFFIVTIGEKEGGSYFHFSNTKEYGENA